MRKIDLTLLKGLRVNYDRCCLKNWAWKSKKNKCYKSTNPFYNGGEQLFNGYFFLNVLGSWSQIIPKTRTLNRHNWSKILIRTRRIWSNKFRCQQMSKSRIVCVFFVKSLLQKYQDVKKTSPQNFYFKAVKTCGCKHSTSCKLILKKA